MIQHIRPYFASAAVHLLAAATPPLPSLELPNLYFVPPVLPHISNALGWTLPLLAPLLLHHLIARYNSEKIRPDFVVLIFIHYGNKMAHSKAERLTPLNATKNDVKRLLDHLNYQHDDTTRRWYILLDFECEYEDSRGVKQSLARSGVPSRAIILETIEEAAKDGSSGLIYYGGHSLYGTLGMSSKGQDSFKLSPEFAGRRLEGAGDVSCLVASDGKCIYGKDIFTRLPQPSKTRKASTLTLVFDTCGAEGIAAEFPDISYVYEPGPILRKHPTASFYWPRRNQLVLITAARAHETAGTFKGCGALTFLMTEYLQEHPEASAVELLLYLNTVCETQPDQSRRQHPQIRSRYPLYGPFRLLPRNPRLEPRLLFQAPLGFNAWV